MQQRYAGSADGQHTLHFSKRGVSERVLPIAERWRRQAELLGLSTKARLRLEWIIFHRTVARGSARRTARHFSVSPQTVCHWINRFKGLNLKALEDVPSTPKRKRSWQPDPLVLERMLALRREFPEWGKQTLARVYFERYGEKLSSWQFQRLISGFRMARRKRKLHHGSRGLSPKQRITYAARREAKELWQLDTVTIRMRDWSRYVVTGVEHATKLGYAFAYRRATSRAARDFLERLRYLTQRPIGVILTDNGSEFAGHFDRACQETEVTRFYSRPRRPTDNPESERFNQTMQKEWLLQGNATPDLALLNFSLERWLETYNGERPHHALGLKTPLAVAEESGLLSRTSPSATNTREKTQPRNASRASLRRFNSPSRSSSVPGESSGLILPLPLGSSTIGSGYRFGKSGGGLTMGASLVPETGPRNSVSGSSSWAAGWPCSFSISVPSTVEPSIRLWFALPTP